MKTAFSLLLLCVSFACFAQVNFEKGYLITQTGERIECLIRNVNSIKTPGSFKYKIGNEGAIQTIEASEVKLVEIYNQVKFVRSRVQLEQSSDELSQVSTSRAPFFKEEDVLLTEISSGVIKLYSYVNHEITRFFYQVGEAGILPLVYKMYAWETGRVAYNEDYKNQLLEILTCSSITDNDIRNLEYKESKLVSIFTKYNQCVNPAYQARTKASRKLKFHAYLRPRLNSNSLELRNLLFNSRYEMGSKISFSFGAEAEVILPFNKNKWALFIEPNYQYYSASGFTDIDYQTNTRYVTTVDYSAISIPIGVRYAMFTNSKSSVYIHAMYAFHKALNSSVAFKSADASVENRITINPSPNLGFGLGYKYGKFSVEGRYFTNQNLTRGSFWESTYRQASVILGYQVF